MVKYKYKDLLQFLISLTTENAVMWQKDELSNTSYFYNLSIDQKFLIDQYYSVLDDKPVQCLNLTIFDKEKIFDEIVLCPTLKGEELDNFKLLAELYESVQVQYSNTLDTKKAPILSNIAEALKKRLQAH